MDHLENFHLCFNKKVFYWEYELDIFQKDAGVRNAGFATLYLCPLEWVNFSEPQGPWWEKD